MSSILETHQLKKTCGDVHAVRDASLTIEEGSIVGFLGPNSAGKTTTIGMILGLIHPYAGTVHIAGQRVTVQNPAPLARVSSLVGAEASTVPHLSARNNLRLVANLHGIAEQRITDVLETVWRDYERLVRKEGMKSFRLKVESKQPERLHHDSSYWI